MKSNQRGFTLIELLIVVLIVSILAAIAYPSYQEQIRKSRRVECEGSLILASNALERRYSVSSSYLDAGGNVTLPQGVSATCPADGSGGPFYNVALDAANTTATTFRLTATPTGPQTKDKCGVLSLNHIGLKLQKDLKTGMTDAACW